MITFDVLTLKALISELTPFITGARINKIQQPTRREFIFTLRNNGISKQLYINIDPKLYHMCIITEESFNNRVLTIPKKPPMFCMLLRKYIENSKIISISQPLNERILELNIETSNNVGENVLLCLAVEFMGKHSNIILYDKTSGTIIGCAHNVGSEKSKQREVYGGITYVYPPRQLKSDLLKYDGEINYDTLSENFYMFSKNFADLCRNLPPEKLKSYLRLENVSPAISEDFSKYCLYSELLSGSCVCKKSVNDMVDSYYSHYIYNEKFCELFLKLKNLVNRKLDKSLKSIKIMGNNLLSYSNGDRYRLYGDLLMANIYNLKDFLSECKVFDYENNEEITIPLDESKTIKDNANRYYKLYGKSKTAKQKLTVLIENEQKQKEYFEQVLYSLNRAETLEDLFEISSEIIPQDYVPPKIVSEVYCEKLGDGTRIYIGKNNKQNDYIISKLASDEDIWFHVHNNAGSHVILKTQNLTDELILKCAKLAKENSSVKNSSKIGVIYTKRKYLRKPPGANLGYVTYKNEKEIILD